MQPWPYHQAYLSTLFFLHVLHYDVSQGRSYFHVTPPPCLDLIIVKAPSQSRGMKRGLTEGPPSLESSACDDFSPGQERS